MTSNFAQTVYLSNKMDNMTSNLLGCANTCWWKGQRQQKKKLSSEAPGEWIRVWSCVNRSDFCLFHRTPSDPRIGRRFLLQQWAWAVYSRVLQQRHSCHKEPTQAVNFRVLQGHLCQRHEQSDEGSVYEVWAYNSWEVRSNFQLRHTFEGMGLQIVVVS